MYRLKSSAHMQKDRSQDLRRFYALLDRLSNAVGGPRCLASCTGRSDWPTRGVYFFQEKGEERRESGSGHRIVRVGTHALTASSRTTLWNRLSQHKGVRNTGGGNHRGSIFRLLLGTALINSAKQTYPSWGQGSTASRSTRDAEHRLEALVSTYIGRMPFLWLAIDAESGPDNLRGYVEQNSIALLSNFNKIAIDSPSANWLGHYCSREKVRTSGLWNQRHVEQNYAPEFLDTLESLVAGIGASK